MKEASFGRGASPIPGIDAAALVAQAFEMTTDKPLPAAPIKASDSYVVFKLISREKADKAAFAGAEEQRLSERLRARKGDELLEVFVRGLRKKADREGGVKVNPEAITYTTTEETASL